MYDDWNLSEEEVFTAITRINNLLCLLNLQDKGYDIDDYYFGYCGCGECTNNDFLITLIMIIFAIDDPNQIRIEVCDAEEWLDGQPYRNGINPPENSDFVTEIVIYDLEAEKAIANLVQYPNLMLITAETDLAGEKYWRIALDTWDAEPDDLANICIKIEELKGAELC